MDRQESERLRFRLLKESDFDTWLNLFLKIKGVNRFLAMEHIATPKEQCKYWFEKAFHRYQNDLGGMNALINKNTGEFIGQAGLLIQEVDAVTELEVGYSVLPQFWNQGYATEAAIKCKKFAFENNFTESLISIIHIENISSEKVALKNGMKKERQTVFKEMPVNIFRVKNKKIENE